MKMPVWSKTDHFLHKQRLSMSPIERLQLLADWAGTTSVFYSLDPGERRERFIEIRFARDQRIIGWIEDCPEPVYMRQSKEN